MKTLIRTSDNSSTLPSKERMKEEVVKRTRSLRKPSGKKLGGQKEYDGHKLSCSSVPDEIIDEVLNYCTRWGEALSDAGCVLKISIQTTTNPLEFLSPQLF